MTPEQRLDRAEIHTRQIGKEWTGGSARINYEMAELAKSHRLTDQALRDFINSSRKRDDSR